MLPRPSHTARQRHIGWATAMLWLIILIAHPAEAQVVISGSAPTSRGSFGTSSARGNNTGANGTANSNNPFGNNNQQTDTSASKGLVYAKETPDSILRERVFQFRYRPTTAKIDQLWNPTLDPTGIQFSDPLDALNGAYYLGKGIIGHPHINIFPHLAQPLHYQLQPDPNIGYAKHRHNLWLYQTLTPYSRLTYASSLNKDYLVGVAHSQNIVPGWNIAFDYRLICPEGIYTNSGATNHYLDATTNYYSRDSRLQLTAGIIWQAFNIDENGGLSNDEYFTRQLQSNRAGIPVNLSAAGTIHRELEAFGKATYNLERQTATLRSRDSIVARTLGDTLTIFDTLTLVDTIPLHSPHIINAGLLGAEISHERRKRLFADSTLWYEQSATLYWTNDAFPDYRWHNPIKLTLGIKPRRLQAIVATDTLIAFHWLNPFALLQLHAGSLTATLEGEQSTAFADDPDYRYAAALQLALDSARLTTLTAQATLLRQQPDARMLHDAHFSTLPTQTSQLHLNFHHRQTIDLSLWATHLDHHLWYDSTLTLHQGQSPLWLTQAALTLRLQWRWLHLDMQQFLQHSTAPDQLAVPLWASKNSLYADLHLFDRALHLQAGVDIRYHTPFYVDNYSPETGLFYHQQEYPVGNYLWGDIFINIQVKRASFYARAGHVNALWESSPNYFLLPHYPGQRFGLFWGITWHFFD